MTDRSVSMPERKSGCALAALGFAAFFTAPIWLGASIAIGRFVLNA